MRACIPAETRLALTLRYLATGENFNSLRYLFRISQPSISLIIPEVLDAIYKVLVDDFIKVIIFFSEVFNITNQLKFFIYLQRFRKTKPNGRKLRSSSTNCGNFLIVSVQ